MLQLQMWRSHFFSIHQGFFYEYGQNDSGQTFHNAKNSSKWFFFSRILSVFLSCYPIPLLYYALIFSQQTHPNGLLLKRKKRNWKFQHAEKSIAMFDGKHDQNNVRSCRFLVCHQNCTQNITMSIMRFVLLHDLHHLQRFSIESVSHFN